VQQEGCVSQMPDSDEEFLDQREHCEQTGYGDAVSEPCGRDGSCSKRQRVEESGTRQQIDLFMDLFKKRLEINRTVAMS
jgi:hypothetical protein